MHVEAQLSEAELHAMKLDGDIFIDEFGQPTCEPCHWLSVVSRLRKTLDGLPDHAIAIGETAAWCWGQLPCEPSPLQVSASQGMRLHHRSTTARRIRSLTVQEHNVVAIAGHLIESRASLRAPDRRHKRRQCVEPHSIIDRDASCRSFGTQTC